MVTKSMGVSGARSAIGSGSSVTIAAIAKRAGVSGQTVLNHFGSKEELATAAYEHLGKEITLRRYEPEPGDVRGALKVLIDDYEITGDAVIRMLARARFDRPRDHRTGGRLANPLEIRHPPSCRRLLGTAGRPC